MRKLLTFGSVFSLLLASFFILKNSKSATVHITIKNFKGSVIVFDPQLQYDLTKYNEENLPFDKDSSASYTVDIEKPTYLIVKFSSDNTVNSSLFLTPGDDLYLSADFSKKDNRIAVTGRGSNNNQPEIFSLVNMDMQTYKEDTIPYRAIAAINKQYLINKSILANYIKVYKPTPEFIESATINLQYFSALNYYESHHSNAFGKPKTQEEKWQTIQDSLFKTIDLNNNDGLNTSYNHTRLVDDFILYKSSDLWADHMSKPVEFYKEWFNCDTASGKKLFGSDQSAILARKVIDKYLTGEVRKYAYGQSIKYQFLYKKNYPSAISLYDDLKKIYPESTYIKTFNTPISTIINRQQEQLDSFAKNVTFIAENGTKLNTLDDVYKVLKTKYVVVDMWGTWCSPCRQEIEKNAVGFRNHVDSLWKYNKRKDVTFLYIANRDCEREKEWKKQITYLGMQGTHILANPKLTENIMATVKATAYPTYIFLQKNGETYTPQKVHLEDIRGKIDQAFKTVSLTPKAKPNYMVMNDK